MRPIPSLHGNLTPVTKGIGVATDLLAVAILGADGAWLVARVVLTDGTLGRWILPIGLLGALAAIVLAVRLAHVRARVVLRLAAWAAVDEPDAYGGHRRGRRVTLVAAFIVLAVIAAWVTASAILAAMSTSSLDGASSEAMAVDSFAPRPSRRGHALGVYLGSLMIALFWGTTLGMRMLDRLDEERDRGHQSGVEEVF